MVAASACRNLIGASRLYDSKLFAVQTLSSAAGMSCVELCPDGVINNSLPTDRTNDGCEMLDEIRKSRHCHSYGSDNSSAYIDCQSLLKSREPGCYWKGLSRVEILVEGLATNVVERCECIALLLHKDETRSWHFSPTTTQRAVQAAVLLADMTAKKNLYPSFCCCDGDSEMTLDDWKSERREEVWKAYQLKYGEHINGGEWDSAVEKVTAASLRLDMFSIPLNKKLLPSKVNSRNSLFILYNFARLCKVKQHFKQKVEQGTYPPLLSLDEVDFTLLKEEPEWQLVIQYILTFPVLMDNLLHGVVNKCAATQISMNKIYQFLLSMSRDISCYYQQTKILLEGRIHLYPLMFARLYLTKALLKVMRHCFYLLEVDPPLQM